MRSIFAFVSLSMLLLVSAGCQQQDSSVTLHVPGMMCEESCVQSVKKTLAGQPGVKEVKVDFETKQAMLVVDGATFDAKAAVEELVDRQFLNAKLVPNGEP